MPRHWRAGQQRGKRKRLLTAHARRPEAGEAALRKRLRGRFPELRAAVEAVAQGTVRASSLVENYNGRLRDTSFSVGTWGQTTWRCCNSS